MSVTGVKKCFSCQVELRLAGRASFRLGETRGAWKLVAGEWAELGEGLLPSFIYVCLECGRIELLADEGAKWDLIMGVQGTVEQEEIEHE